MDMDNIAKCILDALNGVAYVDDRQVALQASRAHDLSRVVRIVDTVDIVKPLLKHEQYTFVRVEESTAA